MRGARKERPELATDASDARGYGLVVASNRLPVSLQLGEDGIVSRRSSGGLVSALEPCLRGRSSCWVGWPGADAETLARDPIGVRRELRPRPGEPALRPVHLSAEELRRFYQGFSNEVLWPALHGLRDRCGEGRGHWAAYQEVNRRFAHVLSRQGGREVPCWVHDYHLISVGRYLRELDPDRALGFFLHVPFPERSSLAQVPYARRLVEDLLAYDVVGFQTRVDCENYVRVAQQALGARVRCESMGPGDGVWVEASGRRCLAGVFPIGIDFEASRDLPRGAAGRAASADLEARLRGRKLLLGIDRLDYTKGLPEKLEALECLLEGEPGLRGEIQLFQLAVPSREGTLGYDGLRAEVDARARRLNERFGRADWRPVDLVHGTVSRAELGALYRRADVALVTPLRDGMNLVAKELCAAQTDARGALVLGEGAGAAQQLGPWSIVVDPRRPSSIADGIRAALAMSPRERKRRMRSLQAVTRRCDASWWSSRFVKSLLAAHALREPIPVHAARLA